MRALRSLTLDVSGMLKNRNVSVENETIAPAVRDTLNSKKPVRPSVSAENE